MRGKFQWVDPLTGALLRAVDFDEEYLVDLASCTGGNTITVAKDLPNGRFSDSDQFTLQLSGGGLAQEQTQTTTGVATGLQEVDVGPLLVVDGAVLRIDEAPSASTDFANYERSWQCIDQVNNDALLASGAAFPGSVTIPSSLGSTGSSVLCTITNRLPPQVSLNKTAQPVSGTPVEVGDRLTYTLNVEVVNGPTQSDVVLNDTLGAGLTYGSELSDISPFTKGNADGVYILPAGTDSGAYSMEYTAIVQPSATIKVDNAVDGTGGGNQNEPNPSKPNCAPGACQTEHPLVAAVVLSKSADPLPGTRVNADSLITYTIEVDVVQGATVSELRVTDQLGQGLTYAGAIAPIAPFSEPQPGVFTLPANTQPGEYYIQYRASVDAQATVKVNNEVRGEGGSNEGPYCAPGNCRTEHLIDPIITLSKAAVPTPGTFVRADQSLTYTINVVVDKGPTQSPVVITDQLGDGLTYEGVDGPIAPFVETAPGVFTLPLGTDSGPYSLSYTAKVTEDATVKVNNSVKGSGGGYPDLPNPSEPGCSPGPCKIEHPVVPTILLSKDADLDSETPVEVGDTLTYTITLQVLNGPTLSEVKLTDTFSDGLSFENTVEDISPFTKVPGSNVYTLPEGTPTGEYRLSYTATVDSNATGMVKNEVEAEGGGTGNPGDPGYVKPTCISLGACTTKHPLKFAVLLSKEADPASGAWVQQDDEIEFTLNVDVVFSKTQSPVVITDQIGEGLTYNGVVGDMGPFEEGPEGVFTLPADTPPGEYSIKYTATVNEDATVTVKNSVSGTDGGNIDTPDPNYPGPQCDYDEDRVCKTEHRVDPTVLLSKTADPESGTPVEPGDTLTYTVQVEVRNGPTQSNVVLNDVMGDGLSFDRVVETGDFIFEPEGQYFYLPSGAATGPYEIRYAAIVDADASVSVNNRVEGTGGGGPNQLEPECAPGLECETTHPLVPVEVMPVPLGSLPWNALLAGTMGLVALWLGGRRRLR